MSIKLVNDDSLTNIASAIRIKGSISGTLEFPDGFVSAIQAIPSGITPSGTLSITSNGVYDVGSFASADVNVSGGGGDTGLVDFLEGNIGSYFENSEALVVGSYKFCSNTNLQSVYFPNAKTISSQAFYGCANLTSANFPQATVIGHGAFSYCQKLVDVNFPELISMTGSGAFNGDPKITTVIMPKLQYITVNAFAQCSALSITQFDNVQGMSGSAFNGCRTLSTISFPKLSFIGPSAFLNCKSLMSVYLLSTSVAVLSNTNAFNSTPMSASNYTGAFGSIYVPASLVSNYKAASKWSTYADRITSYVEG